MMMMILLVGHLNSQPRVKRNSKRFSRPEDAQVENLSSKYSHLMMKKNMMNQKITMMIKWKKSNKLLLHLPSVREVDNLLLLLNLPQLKRVKNKSKKKKAAKNRIVIVLKKRKKNQRKKCRKSLEQEADRIDKHLLRLSRDNPKELLLAKKHEINPRIQILNHPMIIIIQMKTMMTRVKRIKFNSQR